jgi:hypothetical protein
MKRVLFVALTLTLSPVFADNNFKPLVNDSKTVVKEFMGQLKGKLQAAMKSGGPTKAINVCKDSAPVIAQNLSDKYGWRVARTSLKTRNPANTADEWEKEVLQNFNMRKQNGEKVKPMAYFAEVEEKGVKVFRFMKAIPTGDVCLKCHGDNIAPSIASKLKESYPADEAIGYKLGDVRGAFTITQYHEMGL